MKMLDTEVLIVGRGPVGATLAGLLGQRGVDCIVLEGMPRVPEKSTPDPRALALTHASRRILQSTNIWQNLPGGQMGHFRKMYVWDENGKGEIKFDSDELCETTLGYIIGQGLLEETLARGLEFIPSVTTLHGNKPSAIQWDDDAVTVELNDSSVRAKLLVAADGVNSKTREMAGIGYTTHDYRQTAVACIVKTALPHNDTARQRFLTDGPLAFLPMADPNQSGVVWSTRPNHAGQLMAMDDERFNYILKTAFAGKLGVILENECRTPFPLQRAQAEHYCRDRFVLIGDAAHSVHPLAGQGVNLGLLDSASLAQVLLEARKKNRDIGNIRVLRQYERWRKGENRFMMMIFEGFKYLFENQINPVPQIRNMGLNLVDRKSFIKQFIMRRAMGLEGDLPAAARAEVL